MEKMNNVIIDRAERGKSGQESWGKWQAWSVWFVGLQAKFDYFERDNVVPFPGMQVILAEYTMEQAGQYTNYKLKKLVPAQLAGSPVLPGLPVQGPRLGEVNTPKPDLKPSPFVPVVTVYEKEKRLMMCTSYAKDLMVQLIAGGSYPTLLLSPVIDLVAKGGKLLAEKMGGEPGDVIPPPAIKPSIPEPPELTGQKFANEVIAPAMAEAANKILVTPTVLPTPEENIPKDDIPF